MSSLIYLVLLVLWGTECSSLTLIPTTTTISRDGTHNFSLTCSIKDQHENHPEVDIKGLRILKFENHEWTPVAEMDSDWQSPRTMEGLESSALVGGSDVNYLQVMWPLATNETSGQFMCDVIGYSKTQEAISLRSPSVYVDVEVPLTLFYLLKMFKSTNKKLETGLGDISTLKDRVSQSEKAQDDLSGSYFEQWPQGVYSLTRTRSHCPANIGVTWKTGWRQHHTESQSRNKDQVSTRAHMRQTIMAQSGGKKYIFQHFCSVTTPSIGRLWPTGSYCVMRYQSSSCPIGFQVGSIYWDDEDTSNDNDLSSSPHPVAETGANTKIYYCCRNDSSPLSPIHLPTTKQLFYLHRYGGTCQEVAGMNVTSEFMLFHTQSGSRYDGFAPDGASFLPMVKLELCYYQKE